MRRILDRVLGRAPESDSASSPEAAPARSPREDDPAPSPSGPAPASVVVIDHRERPSGLPLAVARQTGSEPRLATLEVGDVLVGSRYLIERKTWTDLSASLVDGRLLAQAAAMRRSGRSCAIILEGDWADAAESGVDPAALRGALVSVAFDHGIPVLPSSSVEGTAKWIASIARRCRTEGAPPGFAGVTPTGERREAAPPARPSRTPKSAEARAREQAIDALAALAGVGRSRAEALLARFGDIAGVAAADPGDLEATPGVGRVLSRRIHATLRGSPSPRSGEAASPSEIATRNIRPKGEAAD